jgi:ABC-type iron transport system FetAB permease component
MSIGARRVTAALALACLLSLALLAAAPHSHRSADECLLCRIDRIAVVLTSAPAVDTGLLLSGAAPIREGDAVRLQSVSLSRPRAPPV